MTQRFSTVVAAMFSVAVLAAPALALADDDARTKLAHHVDDVFARLDTDKDGRISKDEASAGPRLSKHFDKVDVDHDGFITRAELTTAIAHRAAARQAAKER